MSEHGDKIIQYTTSIETILWEMYSLLSNELSRPDKAFDVQFNGFLFKFHPSFTIEEKLEQSKLRRKLITEVMHEALMLMLNTIHDEDTYYSTDHWKFVKALVSGEDPRDHQIELIKEEVVSNLDADGNPIVALPLNEDNVLVQWQDQNRFKF